MKLYNYEDFIKESIQSKEDIDSICKEYDIENYTINKDGTIDVDDDVDLSGPYIYKFPLKFGKVTGNFYCSMNRLTSLEGSPKEVGGYFDCSRNNLTSLEGSPHEVGNYFDCSLNELTSLEGCPTDVDGSFICCYNKLKSFKGPKKVGGDFYCYSNEIKDVKGFDMSLSGSLEIIYIDNDYFTNPVSEIFKLFPEERWKEVPEFLNEYDVIRDGKKVVLQALELVYDELGLDVPENIVIEGYEII